MKFHKTENGNPDYVFFCPGCKCDHGIWIRKPEYGGPSWEFNGDIFRPTVSPSILVRYPTAEPHFRNVCHSFITDGRIQFLSDCTHSLAGHTVDLPDYE